MTTTAQATDASLARVHDLPLAPRVRPEAPSEADRTPPRLALSGMERLRLTRLVDGDAEPLLAHVADRATALASDEGARRRLLARQLAVADAEVQQLGTALMDAVRRRDTEAGKIIDRLLKSATKRVCVLADELRNDFAGGKKSVLVIGSAEQVTVGP